MLHRRHFLTLAALAAVPGTASAQSAAPAAFVKSVGDQMVAVINGAASASAKKAAMTRIVDQYVDVAGIARFCLGRFWNQATPDQQRQYLSIFHAILVVNITAKLGEYQGVQFTLGTDKPMGDDVAVSTTVIRPNNPPTKVDWVIGNPSTSPKIVDVVAEGTSMRITQRNDYASFLTHHDNSIAALIAALQQQIKANE